MGDRILAAGSFRYISTRIGWTQEHLTGGEAIDIPLALYDPSTDTWEGAAPQHPSRWVEGNTITGVDIDGGRLAIAGRFTMKPSTDGPLSRNVAVTDRILSVPPTQANLSTPFRLVHRNGRLLLETEVSSRLTIELYDVGGRLLAQLFDEVVAVGQREIVVPEGVQGAVLVVVRDEEGRSVGKIIGSR